MSIFDNTCVWCGESFELEAHDNDVESFQQEIREHKYHCKERPEDEKFVKKVLKVIKGMDLEQSRNIVKEILYGSTIAPHSNSPTASAEAEDLISVKEEFQK